MQSKAILTFVSVFLDQPLAIRVIVGGLHAIKRRASSGSR